MESYVLKHHPFVHNPPHDSFFLSAGYPGFWTFKCHSIPTSTFLCHEYLSESFRYHELTNSAGKFFLHLCTNMWTKWCRIRQMPGFNVIPNISSTQATSKDTWFFFPKFVPKTLLRSTTSDLLFKSSLGHAHTYPALYSVHLKSARISLLSCKVVQLVLMLDFFYCYLMRCALPCEYFGERVTLTSSSPPFILFNYFSFYCPALKHRNPGEDMLLPLHLSQTVWGRWQLSKYIAFWARCQFKRILGQRIVWSDYYINTWQLFNSVFMIISGPL